MESKSGNRIQKIAEKKKKKKIKIKIKIKPQISNPSVPASERRVGVHAVCCGKPRHVRMQPHNPLHRVARGHTVPLKHGRLARAQAWRIAAHFCQGGKN
jgi:hypothetical protein